MSRVSVSEKVEQQRFGLKVESVLQAMSLSAPMSLPELMRTTTMPSFNGNI